MLFITIVGYVYFALYCIYPCYPCHPWFDFQQYPERRLIQDQRQIALQAFQGQADHVGDAALNHADIGIAVLPDGVAPECCLQDRVAR